MKVSKREVFSIPNILSYIRLLLIPVFIYVYLTATEPSDYYWAAFIVLFSGLTDLFDGYIARHFNQITELGKTLDPVADKLSQGAIIFCLMFQYQYMWILVVIFVAKELFMGINSLILLQRDRKVDGAKWFGKVSTAIFYTTTVLLVAIPQMSVGVTAFLMIVTGIFLLLSLFLYIPEFVKLYRS